MTRWANTDVHGVSMARIVTRKRCLLCPKGARKRITHAIVSNGFTMASGCEWHAYGQFRAMRKGRA